MVFFLTGNLTYLALEIKSKLSEASSLIVIVDDVNWDTVWKDELNKIQNKLEGKSSHQFHCCV